MQTNKRAHATLPRKARCDSFQPIFVAPVTPHIAAANHARSAISTPEKVTTYAFRAPLHAIGERSQRISPLMDALKPPPKARLSKSWKKASEEALKNPETRKKIVEQVKKDPAKALKLAKTLSKTLSK